MAQSKVPSEIVGAMDGSMADRIVQLAALLTALAVIPGLLMVGTCFTRFIIVLSFLRSGLGLQSTPNNMILVTLALFMTSFVMQPTFEEAWREGAKPYLEKAISQEQAASNIVKPFGAFMKAHVRDDEFALFHNIAKKRNPEVTIESAAEDLRVIAPAFMLSEMRRAFEIGFMVILPFLVIDLVVSVIVMSMGMMMMSPSTFSLPLKILFFVLIDGWTLIVSGLMKSFG